MSDPGNPPSPQRPKTFTEKLNRLVAVVHPANRGPYSAHEITTRVRDQGGSISRSYVSELLNGAKTNPTLNHVVALARAFAVSPGYFTDDEVAERVDRELDEIAARSRVTELAERAASLTPADRDVYCRVIEEELRKRRPDQPTPGRTLK